MLSTKRIQARAFFFNSFGLHWIVSLVWTDCSIVSLAPCAISRCLLNDCLKGWGWLYLATMLLHSTSYNENTLPISHFSENQKYI